MLDRMSICARLAVIVLCGVLSSAGPSARGADVPALAPEGEGAFARGLEDVHRLMRDESWQPARDALQALLADHARADYVLLRRAEVCEDLTRCAMRLAVPEPELGQLVSGYADYDERSGELHLRYGPDQLGDFELEDGLSVHPVVFKGPYSIEVSGRRFEVEGTGRVVHPPTILVGVREDEAYEVSFGFQEESELYQRWLPGELMRLEGGQRRALAQVERPHQERGGPFVLKVTVADRDVTVYQGVSRLMRARKQDGVWGGLGFASLPPFDEIVIRGKAHPAWAQGLVDAATRDAERAWSASFDVDAELPAWLRVDQRVTPRTTTEDTLPWRVTRAQREQVQQVNELIADDRGDDALALLLRDETELAPGLRDYLLASALIRVGRLNEALVRLGRVCADQPDFVGARLLRASLLDRGGARRRAADEYELALRADPHRADAYDSLAELYLRTGRIDDAQRLLRSAREQGVHHDGLLETEAIVNKALRGPAFSRRFEHASDHYLVVSDIDEATCRAAARELEQAYERYVGYLGEPPFDGEPSRVYLFAGEAGYAQYTGGLFENAHSSAGLYSPHLKQLLAWNLPDRNDMMRTIRHEGLHQFFDQLGVVPPTWFNEGLAEYCAHLERDRRHELVEGGVRDSYARVLQAHVDSLVPLATFVRLQGEPFYDAARITYPQAWALVHFLRHGDQEWQALHERLLAAVRSGLTGDELFTEVFGDVDFERFDAAFARHVRGLSA